LRDRQRDLVRELLRQEVLAPLLYRQNKPTHAALFGISEEELVEAERSRWDMCS
jgi:hypothetical protein